MKFYTAYDLPESKYHIECPKERTGYIFDRVTDDLVQTETIPFYEEIQSHYESTRLDHKIEQFRRGNTFALGVPNESYIDVTNVPSDLADVLNSRQKVIDEFNNLPEGIRSLFGNDFGSFASSLSDGSYESKLAEYARGVVKDTGNQSSSQPSSGHQGGAE